MKSITRSFVRTKPFNFFKRVCLSNTSIPSAWAPGSPTHVDAVVRRLTYLFETFGESDYIGEPLSIAGHSLQAALCAQAAGEGDEVQLAALLHDVGHLLGLEAGFPPAMDGCGTEDHEHVGAEFIRDLGLSDDVAYLTSQHVSAKRYLVWRDPLRELSDASRTTLKHQGGPMGDEEAAEAEADPRWEQVLALRSFDEAAKDPSLPMPPLQAMLQPLVTKNLVRTQQQSSNISNHSNTSACPYVLSREQLRRYHEDGFLLVKGALAPTTVARLPLLADALAGLASPSSSPSSSPAEAEKLVPHGVLVHHELTADRRASASGGGSGGGVVRLCRVENFCSAPEPRPTAVTTAAAAAATTTPPEGGGLGFGWAPICFDVVQSLVSQVYGEPAVLFKDKLNFKAPGGAGFLCHQDATAYATDNLASRHVSAMVAVDAAMVSNGAVEVAKGRHKEGVFPNEAGVMASNAAMEFTPVLVEPGDVVLFDSYLPHRSGPNTTSSSRRLAYLTFSPLSEGDHRLAYYAAKAELMQQGTISINNDFAGVIVD